MRTERGPGGALFLFLALGLLGVALAARRWLDVVEVRGGSMAPTLLPGDRLLVERWSFSRRAPRVGELVLAVDPREPWRELIKRVATLRDDVVELRGDAPDASTDSRAFGPVPASSVRWRVAVRYRRAGNAPRGRPWSASPR